MCRHGVGERFLHRHFRHRTRSRSRDLRPGTRVLRDGHGCRDVGEKGWEAVMFTIEELATIPLFSTLGEKELEYLAGAVEDIHLIPGEYVAHEGEGRSLAIVVEGKTELTKLVNGVEQVIGVRLPGEARRRDPDDARYAVARQHASRRAIARTEGDGRGVPHARRHGPPGLRNGRCRRVGAHGDAQKRHRAAARARDVRNRPAPRPGSARLRQLPASQPDSLRTPGPRRSCRCCTHRRWSRHSWPLSGGGAARRHSADCPDDACRCHGRWTDGRARPGALRRGDRGRRAGGSDGGGQQRLRGPADRADRVLRPRRAGRYLHPDRELHGVPIRRLR